jgi:hypothetical protein
MILMRMRLGRGCEAALVEVGIFANLISGRKAAEVRVITYSQTQ